MQYEPMVMNKSPLKAFWFEGGKSLVPAVRSQLNPLSDYSFRHSFIFVCVCVVLHINTARVIYIYVLFNHAAVFW